MHFLYHISIQYKKMGSSSSADTEFEEWLQWITDRAFKDTNYDFTYRHLTESEKAMINFSIIRIMETRRRIDTKLTALSIEDEHILDVLDY